MPMQIGMFVRRLTHFLFFRDNELLGDAGEFGKTCKNEAAVAAAGGRGGSIMAAGSADAVKKLLLMNRR